MRDRYHFYRNCIGWPEDDVDAPGGLSDLVTACVGITRRTFLRHVEQRDLRTLEAELGYSRHPKQGLTMAADWHVSYFRSVWHGLRVYGFDHSRIEYVFVPAGAEVQRALPMFTTIKVSSHERRAAGCGHETGSG